MSLTGTVAYRRVRHGPEGVAACQSAVDRRDNVANSAEDAEQDRCPVPNFTVSNKSFGNHRNSMREGREEGPNQWQPIEKHKCPLPF